MNLLIACSFRLSIGGPADPVAEVGDPFFALEDAGAFQLDLFGGKAVEEAAALSEEHWDEVDLELVEDAGGERQLCRAGAMDEHVLVARGLLRPGHGGLDV